MARGSSRLAWRPHPHLPIPALRGETIRHMFSGIVEELGEVAAFDGESLDIKASIVLSDLKISDSICVSGACLTVISTAEGGFTVEVVPETIERTNFGTLEPGSSVNLERPLAYGGRVGGHFVQGHVDGLGTIDSITPDGNSLHIWLKADTNIMRYVVEKGFIAIDGISLTIVDVAEGGFSVAIIPYTNEHTTLGSRQPGDAVNIEVDITAKYVEQFTLPHLDKRTTS